MEFVDFMGCAPICSAKYRDFVNYYRPHILNIYRVCGCTIVVDGMFGLLSHTHYVLMDYSLTLQLDVTSN